MKVDKFVVFYTENKHLDVSANSINTILTSEDYYHIYTHWDSINMCIYPLFINLLLLGCVDAK